MNYLRNAWYCAALSEEVGEAPFARRILDEPVLIARDTEGAARAMSDMCPHRFAPLHKGIREGDSIECPYHGLRFDLGGRCVHNPHGSGRIPAAADLHAYPIVERQGVVWLWPGDPAAADESLLVDLRLIPRDGAPIAGHLEMAVDYRLVIDNLLDLSHVPYIHPGTLAPARMARQSHFDAGDRSLQCRYLMRDVETPSSQALLFPHARGDFHSEMEWIAPSTLRHRVGMAETDAPVDEGSLGVLAHLITPSTATSTHYFWLASRNRRIDDASLDDALRAIITKAFVTEDEPMIAACQDYMAGREFFAMRPLYLDSDYAGTRCRRILEKLIDGEAGVEARAVSLIDGEPAF